MKDEKENVSQDESEMDVVVEDEEVKTEAKTTKTEAETPEKADQKDDDKDDEEDDKFEQVLSYPWSKVSHVLIGPKGISLVPTGAATKYPGPSKSRATPSPGETEADMLFDLDEIMGAVNAVSNLEKGLAKANAELESMKKDLVSKEKVKTELEAKLSEFVNGKKDEKKEDEKKDDEDKEKEKEEEKAEAQTKKAETKTEADHGNDESEWKVLADYMQKAKKQGVI